MRTSQAGTGVRKQPEGGLGRPRRVVRARREDGAMAPILWKNKCSAAANSMHNPLYLRFAIQPYSRSVCGLAAKIVWNLVNSGQKKGGFVPYRSRRRQAVQTRDGSNGGEQPQAHAIEQDDRSSQFETRGARCIVLNRNLRRTSCMERW